MLDQNGTILSSPRLPDFIPLDFYLWNHIEETVYSKDNENHFQLKDIIVQAFQ